MAAPTAVILEFVVRSAIDLLDGYNRECPKTCLPGKQDYLVLADTASSTTWMINGTMDADNTWQLIPVKPVLPCMMPAGLRHFASSWRVTGAPQPMVKAAVKEGCFIRKEDLLKLKTLLGFSLPTKSKDKIDYCRAFVKHLWPEASDDEFEEMVSKMMGKIKGRTIRCPKAVLQAVEELSKTDQREFEHLRDAARNQCKVQDELRKARADAGQAAGERKTFTPDVLQKLLPRNVTGCFLHRNPLIKRYQAGYPGSLSGNCCA